MHVRVVCARDCRLSAAGSGTKHATALVVRTHRFLHLVGGESQYVFWCLEVPESSRRLGGSTSREMELVVPVGNHDIYYCRESKAHQESDSYTTIVADNG